MLSMCNGYSVENLRQRRERKGDTTMVAPLVENTTRVERGHAELTLPLAQGVARLLGLPIAPGLVAFQGLSMDCYTQFLQQKAPHIEGIVGQREATHRCMVIAARVSKALLFLSHLRFEAQKLTYVRQHLLSAFTRLPWYLTPNQTQHIYQLHTRLFGSPLDASPSRAVFPSPRYQTNDEVLVLHFLAAPKVAGLYHLVMEQGYEQDLQTKP